MPDTVIMLWYKRNSTCEERRSLTPVGLTEGSGGRLRRFKCAYTGWARAYYIWSLKEVPYGWSKEIGCGEGAIRSWILRGLVRCLRVWIVFWGPWEATEEVKAREWYGLIYILEKYPFDWNMKDGLGKGKIAGRKSSQNSLVIKEKERERWPEAEK